MPKHSITLARLVNSFNSFRNNSCKMNKTICRPNPKLRSENSLQCQTRRGEDSRRRRSKRGAPGSISSSSCRSAGCSPVRALESSKACHLLSIITFLTQSWGRQRRLLICSSRKLAVPRLVAVRLTALKGLKLHLISTKESHARC